jgi:hypothetical protein
MQGHRIDAAPEPASRPPADGRQTRRDAARLSAVTSASPDARVLALGGPVSVLIRPQPCELPLLRDRVLAEIAAHDRNHPRPRPSDPRGELDQQERWMAARRAWQTMLDALDPNEPLELLWPTAYAHSVLHGALSDALAAVEDPGSDPEALLELADALDAARACLTTLIAYDAVDGGGLQDVDL